MPISPKAKRNLSRIWPFGLIWLITGWVFLFVELIAAGSNNPNPSAAITLTLPVFLFASLAVTLVGLMIGALEMIYLENLFRNESFLNKLIYKFVLYSVFLMMIITLFYPIAAAIELGTTPFAPEIWARFGRFLVSLTFLSTLIQMSFSLLLCLLYAGVSENLGHAVLMNFFTGKYHSPKQELRIFMFLDMKSSTTIAERIGHVQYFDLLREYYNDLSSSIIDYGGEVYQYVGDEVVISWNMEKGLKGLACIRCFFAMHHDVHKRSDWYKSRYDAVPDFKAGLHFGEVTTGEVGALKKEIVFSGDVLNATSRIQGLCSRYDASLLVSGSLMERIQEWPDDMIRKNLGEANLTGRSQPVVLFDIKESQMVTRQA